MLVRLEEFENIVSAAKEVSTEATSNIAKIVAQKEELYRLCKRIEDVERFIELMDRQVTTAEHVVNVAEAELGISESLRLSSMFKNMFKKSPSASNISRGSLQLPPVLDPSNFFQESGEGVDAEVDQTAQDALLDSDFFNDIDEGDGAGDEDEVKDSSSDAGTITLMSRMWSEWMIRTRMGKL